MKPRHQSIQPQPTLPLILPLPLPLMATAGLLALLDMSQC